MKNPIMQRAGLTFSVIGLIAGTTYILKPSLDPAGWIFALALLITVLLASFSASHSRGRNGGLAWAWFTAISFLMLPLLQLAKSSANAPDLIATLLSFIPSMACLLGAAIHFLPRKPPQVGFGNTPERPATSRSVLNFLGSFLMFGLGAGMLGLAIITYRGPDKGLAGVLLTQFLPLMAMAFPAWAALAVRAARRFGFRPLPAFLGGLPALATFVIALIPLVQTPGLISRTETAFAATWGLIPADLSKAGMRDSAFNPGGMILAWPEPLAVLKADQAWLAMTDSAGKSHTFRFDQWSPQARGMEAPASGKASSSLRPVLIRIHGGAWVSGDKGSGNMNTMNRWFAQQGYEVFDLQYGLNDKAQFSLRAPTPPEPIGPWTMDDMVSQLGSFTVWLADHALELGIDTRRVFISGNSAGGQLTLALALAASSGYRDSHPGMGVDPRLDVRGVLPFYPAIAYASTLGIPSDPALDDPTALLGPSNPPALIYQGSIDGLVSAEKIREFASAWNSRSGSRSSGRAMVIEFPLAGHGSDLIFWNCFNQVYLYYMERCMSLWEKD